MLINDGFRLRSIFLLLLVCACNSHADPELMVALAERENLMLWDFIRYENISGIAENDQFYIGYVVYEPEPMANNMCITKLAHVVADIENIFDSAGLSNDPLDRVDNHYFGFLDSANANLSCRDMSFVEDYFHVPEYLPSTILLSLRDFVFKDWVITNEKSYPNYEFKINSIAVRYSSINQDFNYRVELKSDLSDQYLSLLISHDGSSNYKVIDKTVAIE